MVVTMETVFDLATLQELVALFGDGFDDAGYEALRRHAIESADFNFSQLASLFSIRGDMTQADSYIARIQDDALRLATSMGIYECTPR